MNLDGTPDINDVTKFGETATGFIGAVKKLLPGISIASCHRGARRGTKLEMKDVETILSVCKKNGLPQEYAEDFIRGAMKRHRRSMNLAGVVASSEPDIDESASIDNVDDEWLEHFQDYAEKISDESMQVIWGKILSGEINKPGTYSKRLLNVLSQMSKTEAEAFLTLCSFRVTHLLETTSGFIKGNKNLIVAVQDEGDETFNNSSFDLENRSVLESIGLIDSSINRFFDFPPKYRGVFKVGDSIVVARNNSNQKKELRFSPVITPLGVELAKVCNPKPAKGLDELFQKHAEKQGISIV